MNTIPTEHLSENKSLLLQKLLRRKPAVTAFIHKAPEHELIPLSFSQQRLWFLDQYITDKHIYNIPLFIKMTGVLDRNALEMALYQMIKRHDIFRAKVVPHTEGPQLYINDLPDLETLIQYKSYTSVLTNNIDQYIHSEMQEMMSTVFSLEEGPLYKLRLLECPDQTFVLLICMHHIIFDGWSQQIWVKEWSSLYNHYIQSESQINLAPLQLQYQDYAYWQHQQMKSDAWDRQLLYWKEQLSEPLPVLSLPTDYLRPASQTFSGQQYICSLSFAHSQQLKNWCVSNEYTPHMVFLAIYIILLSSYSHQKDIMIGTPVANRNYQEIEQTIGMFVNTVIIRSKISDQDTFIDIVEQVRTLCLQAYTHQDIPFEKLVEQLSPNRSASTSPLFQTLFSMQTHSDEKPQLTGLTTDWLDIENNTAKCDLSLFVSEGNDYFSIEWQYNTALFCEDTIIRMNNHFQIVLQQVLSQPNQLVQKINILTESEQKFLDDVNHTQNEYHPQSVPQLFHRVAQHALQDIAIQEQGRSLTYTELDQLSNAFSQYLKQHGLQKGERVAVCLKRSAQFIIAILGILKAGGTYVPLDPDLPVSRLEYIFQDSEPALIVSHSSLRAKIIQNEVAMISFDEELEQHLRCIPTDSKVDYDEYLADAPAYMIYTSGSTGQPKGVVIPHRGIIRLIQHTNYIDIQSGHCIAQIANASFDAVTFEIWGALLNGATLIIADQQTILTPYLFEQWMKKYQITHMFITVTLFNKMAELYPSTFDQLHTLLVGGEACHPKWINEVVRQGKPLHLLNGYGPTESTTFALTYEIKEQIPESKSSVPIGQPISNTQAYILDEYLRPMPVNTVGELYIGGDGLAIGYWNRESLNHERFIDHPFQQGEKLYKTGDLAKWLDDGNIDYIGRTDQQIKLRGYRIEIGEIEEVIRRYEFIQQAIVRVVYNDQQEPFLAGYYTASQHISKKELRYYLSQLLADYMVPTAFIQVTEFQLTVNGKINSEVLPHIQESDIKQELYVAPQTEMEQIIAMVWSNLLGIEKISIYDSFFTIGGHSLLGIQVTTELEHILELSLSIRLLFEYPTIQELAHVLDQMWFETDEDGVNDVG